MLTGFIPRAEIVRNPGMLYIAIGILGATVMPHNLYLHSSIVQTRKFATRTRASSEAIHFATIDSTVALMFALFINAAILVMAAAAFHGAGHDAVAEIGDAYNCFRRCSARSWRAFCSPWRCSLRDRTRRSPARWRGRS